MRVRAKGQGTHSSSGCRRGGPQWAPSNRTIASKHSDRSSRQSTRSQSRERWWIGLKEKGRQTKTAKITLVPSHSAAARAFLSKNVIKMKNENGPWATAAKATKRKLRQRMNFIHPIIRLKRNERGVNRVNSSSATNEKDIFSVRISREANLPVREFLTASKGEICRGQLELSQLRRLSETYARNAMAWQTFNSRTRC